jgi:hypothetical protein
MATENKPSKDVKTAILNQLKNPFDPQLVKWRTGGGSKQLAYIDARDVMKRLDTVMGADNYQTKYIPLDGGFICELSLKIGGEWITRSDGANNTKVEPIKGGISSALKRAANAWGIGRYLYYLDPSKFNARNVHQWPAWALPNNEVENWEDIAELEAGMLTGMDEEEVATSAINSTLAITEAKSREELKKVVDGLSAEEQRLLTDVINNKTDELLENEA